MTQKTDPNQPPDLLNVNRALKTLSAINRALVRATEETELFHQVCQILVTIGEYPFVWVGLVHSNHQDNQDNLNNTKNSNRDINQNRNQNNIQNSNWIQILPVAEAGNKENYRHAIQASHTEQTRWINQANWSTQTILIQPDIIQPDIIQPDRSQPERSQPDSVTAIVLPLIWENLPLGTLNVYTSASETPQQPDLDLLQELTDDLAYGIITLRTRIAHRHIETALQRSEERLRIALEAAQVGMWDWNLLTGEIQWSDGHEQLFGMAPGSFDGRHETFEHYVHPNDQAELAHAVQQAKHNKCTYKHEFRVIWNDGSIHWIEGRGKFYYNEMEQPVWMTGAVIGIDDRKQVETALRQSETKYRLLFENNPNPMWVYDCQTLRFLAVNTAAIQLYGYSETEFLSMTIDDIRPSSEVPALLNAVARVSNQGYSNSGEWQHCKKNGTTIDVEIVSNAIVWSGIQARCVLVKDISDRKRAEHELKQAKEELEVRVAERTAELTTLTDRLQVELAERQRTQRILQEQTQILDLAHDTIMMLDLNQTIIFWNHGAEVTYGWSKTEAIGQNSTNLLNTQFPKPLPKIWAELMQDNYWEGELIHTKRDGKSVVAASRWVLQCDASGKPTGILEINNDITPRKRTEDALRDSEERFRNAFDNASIGMALISLEGQWLKVNAALCEIVGYSESELLKTTLQTITHPNDLENDVEYRNQLLNREIRSYSIEKRCFCKRGSIIWTLFSISLIQDSKGHPLYLIAQIQDITVRREVERMKDEFISIVSHELRTPLTSIRGSLGLLASGALKNHPERAQRMIEIAAIDIERLVRLVNDILDLERLESGRVTLTKEACNAEELMLRSVEAMRSLANKEEITLVVVPSPARVWASPDHIIQTLTNLLSNAIKFSPRNSRVWLSAQVVNRSELVNQKPANQAPDSQPEPTLRAKTSHSTHSAPSIQVRFKVQDQGRGIPTDKLELIFGRFQQVDASDSRKKGGTGLGLAICQSIVQQHNGDIWVESLPGEGSSFYFTLPVPPDEESNFLECIEERTQE